MSQLRTQTGTVHRSSREPPGLGGPQADFAWSLPPTDCPLPALLPPARPTSCYGSSGTTIPSTQSPGPEWVASLC